MGEISYFNQTGEEIEKEILNISEKLIGESLGEGDERRAIIKAVSYYTLQLGKLINYTAANNFLKHADETTIELLGDFKKVTRRQAEKARTTLKFVREGNLSNVQGIPYRTKVAAGQIVFQTIKSERFEIGQKEIEIEAEAVEFGEESNNFLPGQINQLIDLIPFIISVENITESRGGSDLEDIENYRERIRISPEGYSVAGPAGAYEYWAKTVDSNISDVFVTSPSPAVVEIYPLLRKGELPNSEILDKIYNFFEIENIRPLTDKVEVKAPEKVEYEINLNYYISKENEHFTNSITNTIEKIVSEFILETKNKLGNDINPDKLIFKLLQNGIKRVEITAPLFQKINKNQVAIGEILNLNFGGVEDE